MKTFFLHLILILIFFFSSCNKPVVKRDLYLKEFLIYDEYSMKLNWIDSSGNFTNNISVIIENTDLKVEFKEIDLPEYPGTKIGIFDAILEEGKSYNIIFEGDNVGKFILYDLFFNETVNYIPSVSLTEKSQANIELEVVNCYMGLLLNDNIWEIVVWGKVNKDTNKPFRSFIVYFGDENVSNTNYFYSYTPKISDTSYVSSDTCFLKYYDDGLFDLKLKISKNNFSVNQLLSIVNHGFYAVAYGIAGGVLYDSIPQYDTYIDPITGLTINPGFGEPSNLVKDTTFNNFIFHK